MSRTRHLLSIVSLFLLPVSTLAFAGCETSSPQSDSESEADVGSEDPGPGRAAGLPAPPDPDPCGIGPACDPSIGIADYPVSPSLVLTRNTESVPGNVDAPILDHTFPLVDVLQQLITQSGTSQTPDELLARLWDTQNPAGSSVFNESFAPHCDDAGQTINGFPVDCPKPEGQLAFQVTTTDFTPIAVFNRFDLAPLDGSHCGEYRIIYALGPEVSGGFGGRNFVIFEGQLPNPEPGCGIEACRPVVSFWQHLSTLGDQDQIAEQLRKFYFDGLDGFTPVIEPHHYGFNDGKSVNEGGYGTSGGQIRTNQFMNGTNQAWQLRELHLDVQCEGGCKLYAKPVTVKNNPFFDLFSPTPPLAGAFQSAFVSPSGASQVTSLAVFDPNMVTNLNLIAMNIDNQFNAGQSTSDNGSESYPPQLQPGGSFENDIQNELNTIPSGLTPDEAVRRAQTQACHGCHERSNQELIGNGLKWPSSNKFTHVDEDGTRSQALRCVFLPHRQAVGIGFLQNCGSNPAPFVPADTDCTDFGGGKKKKPASGGIEAAVPEAVFGFGAKAPPGQKATLGGGSNVN